MKGKKRGEGERWVVNETDDCDNKLIIIDLKAIFAYSIKKGTKMKNSHLKNQQ